MTLHRLLFKEIFVPLVLSLLLVSQLLVVMQLLQLNEVLFGSGFDLLGVLRIASYFAPHFGIIAVPLAFLLAVMLGVGRLAEDNELVALSALGRTPRSLYLVPVLMSLVLGVGVGFLSFRGEPWGLRGIHRQLNELIKRNVASDIRPGTFDEEIPRFTVFVGEVTKDGGWKRVLLHDAEGDGTPLLILADRARIDTGGSDALIRLDLQAGELHRADGPGYTKAAFEEGSLALGVQNFLRKNTFNRPASELTLEEMPPAAAAARAAGDLASARRIDAHFHKRLASVVACLIFGLIAVPLAAGTKGARTRAFGATVLAFAAYYVLQTLGNGLGETGRASAVVGAWLPNAVGLVAAAVLALRFRRGAGAA